MDQRAQLVIRADASAEVGTGHVMRCLALAQAEQTAGGEVIFASHTCPVAITERLEREGVRTEVVNAQPGLEADAAETIGLAWKHGAEWVVVDGYVFGADYQKALREAGLRVLFVDDYGHAEHYVADLVLNQNVYATASLYPDRAAHTRLLLGLEYALLRREFWARQDRAHSVAERGERVLVTLGGADADNVTGLVIDAIGQLNLPRLRAVVLVGASNPHAAGVQSVADTDPRVRVRHNVVDMPALMTWADVGITAGGSTCYEAARLGLPCLVTVLSENQRPIAEALAARGVVENLGFSESLEAGVLALSLGKVMADADRRTRMRAAGRALVPGGGAQRVLRTMRGAAAASSPHPGPFSPSV